MSHHPVRNALDIAAVVLPGAAVLGVLNLVLGVLASLASLVWTGIRVYEWYKEKRADRS